MFYQPSQADCLFCVRTSLRQRTDSSGNAVLTRNENAEGIFVPRLSGSAARPLKVAKRGLVSGIRPRRLSLSGGDIYKVHSPVIAGCGKSRQIPDRTAAEGDQGILAAELIFGQKREKRQKHGCLSWRFHSQEQRKHTRSIRAGIKPTRSVSNSISVRTHP